MKATFHSLNNNDTVHSISLVCITVYPGGHEDITVMFDGFHYTAALRTDGKGGKTFRRCGKVYEVNFE